MEKMRSVLRYPFSVIRNATEIVGISPAVRQASFVILSASEESRILPNQRPAVQSGMLSVTYRGRETTPTLLLNTIHTDD